MPYNVMFSNKKEEEGDLGRVAVFCSGNGWTSVYPWEVASDCLCITCFVFSLSSATSPLFIELFLSQCMSFNLPFLFLCSTGGGG